MVSKPAGLSTGFLRPRGSRKLRNPPGPWTIIERSGAPWGTRRPVRSTVDLLRARGEPTGRYRKVKDRQPAQICFYRRRPTGYWITPIANTVWTTPPRRFRLRNLRSSNKNDDSALSGQVEEGRRTGKTPKDKMTPSPETVGVHCNSQTAPWCSPVCGTFDLQLDYLRWCVSSNGVRG